VRSHARRLERISRLAELVSIIESITKAIGVISPRLAVTVFIVASILLCVPVFVPGRVPQIDAFIRDHITSVLLIWLGAGVYSATYPIASGWRAIQNSWREMSRKRTQRKMLGMLTLEEKHILQEYIDLNLRSLQFNITLGRLDPLRINGILKLTQTYGIKGTYMISEDARSYLLKHPDLIATPNNPRKPRTFYGEF
jgi:hypothetical protein